MYREIPENIKMTGWKPVFVRMDADGGALRLVLRVATGRKYWPLFSEVVDLSLGKNDPALKQLEASIQKFTFPMQQRFVDELQEFLTFLYEEKIELTWR